MTSEKVCEQLSFCTAAGINCAPKHYVCSSGGPCGPESDDHYYTMYVTKNLCTGEITAINNKEKICMFTSVPIN